MLFRDVFDAISKTCKDILATSKTLFYKFFICYKHYRIIVHHPFSLNNSFHVDIYIYIYSGERICYVLRYQNMKSIGSILLGNFYNVRYQTMKVACIHTQYNILPQQLKKRCIGFTRYKHLHYTDAESKFEKILSPLFIRRYWNLMLFGWNYHNSFTSITNCMHNRSGIESVWRHFLTKDTQLCNLKNSSIKRFQ